MVLLVIVLNLTVLHLETAQLSRFLIGALLILVGLAVFLLGVELSIDRIGTHVGSAIARSGRVWVVVMAGILLGFTISIAEPDLHILAGQVDMVSGGLISKATIVVVVSVGIALLLSAGLVRIIRGIDLSRMLAVLYGIILVLAVFVSPQYLAISFDASGATTGALTVPFILALALGVSRMKRDSEASENDSFGLVAITSTGAIMSVMVMSIIRGAGDMHGDLDTSDVGSASIIDPFLDTLPTISGELVIALLPILAIFLLLQLRPGRMSGHEMGRALIGLVYTFLGLVLLLTGVNAGFMEVGSVVGARVAEVGSLPLLLGVGFIMGLLTILAEPAVQVLMNQVEDVTSGYVSRKTVLAALSVGVGLSVALSMLRIVVPGLMLWHYLLPGYIIAITLSFFVPRLFVGIAFDSGGVASGPMTATFVLAFAQGVADHVEGASVMLDGFGVIALVALTPLITIQVLGLVYKVKTRRGGIGSEA